MQTKQNISFTSRVNVQSPPLTVPTSRQWWFVVMTACFVGGLALGITGLVLSLLTAAGVLEATHVMSLSVASMIVASLGLLLFGAHALDRMDEAQRKASENDLS